MVKESTRVLYSLWCGLVSAEVLVATQLILLNVLITPEHIRLMNSSESWREAITSIISMLTPSIFGTLLLFGCVVVATYHFSKIIDYKRDLLNKGNDLP